MPSFYPEEKMIKSGNILMCGVGGQGILLASEITALTLIKAGFDVKKSEVHGMAQRGGSVVAHLRFGDKVYSPLIEPGTADIEVAFEMMESLRYLHYLNRKSTIIVNTQKIFPPSVATGIEEYPQEVINELRERKLPVFPLDALGEAKNIGEVRTVNMVIVGALSVFLPVEKTIFLKVINERVPERFRKVNIEAFIKGRDRMKSS
jgi:indolepyruvate ferredoxin oxidoreductase beta subunit